MKIANSHAALRRFGRGRFGHPALPSDPGTVHAVLYLRGPATRLTEPNFIEDLPPKEAACGARVRTILPMSFHTDDDDVCPKCVQHAKRWTEDPAAYIAWVEKRREERRERKELEENLREFRERQARDLG
jgi:hypothetical protein